MRGVRDGVRGEARRPSLFPRRRVVPKCGRRTETKGKGSGSAVKVKGKVRARAPRRTSI